MNDYAPDRWVVIKITTDLDCVYKLFVVGTVVTQELTVGE